MGTGVADPVLLFNFKARIFPFQLKRKRKKQNKQTKVSRKPVMIFHAEKESFIRDFRSGMIYPNVSVFLRFQTISL